LSDQPPHDTLTAASPPPDGRTDWYADLGDELPPRPRIRLLTPLTVTLMLVLFAACGFIGGVLVEKHQTGNATTLLGAAAARLGATGTSGAAGAGGRAASLFGGGAGSRGTIGTVTNVNGETLYVTTAAGTMVAVDVPKSAKVTRAESVRSASIRPGDSVVVQGITASNGTVTASAVSDTGNSPAGAAGGLASLFGGAGRGNGGAASGGGASGTGSGSLFGG
jgi:hypothetical protein